MGDFSGMIRVRSDNGSASQAQFQVQRCADATCATSDPSPPTFNLGTVTSARRTSIVALDGHGVRVRFLPAGHTSARPNAI